MDLLGTKVKESAGDFPPERREGTFCSLPFPTAMDPHSPGHVPSSKNTTPTSASAATAHPLPGPSASLLEGLLWFR